jgi:SAM-dependent methyltransferase
MKSVIKKIIRLIQTPFILADYFSFKRLADDRFSLHIQNAYPCIRDKTIQTGFDRHYVYFTAWAVRKIHELMPATHVDISSTLYFASTVSAFVPVEFYDYRPADLQLSGLQTGEMDITKLSFEDDSVASLSSMHVVEHIGLGRYGDPIDALGDVRAAQELARVLAHGGQLLFVVPVGRDAVIEYNAHRIYSYQAVLDLFPELQLKEFSVILEKSGGIIENAQPQDIENERYACGCFVFTKTLSA